MPSRPLRLARFAASALAAFAAPVAAPVAAQGPVAAPAPSYADLADLADGTPLVVRAQIRDQALVEPERAPGLAPGHARLYVEARTTALIAGNAPVGEALRYLVDVPLDAKGKVPRLKKHDVILFARPVPGRAGEIQLVGPHGQLAYSAELEARLRPLLGELVAPDAPPRVTGVRDVLAVPGTLVGESETQLFLDTENDGPVSITVTRRPGMEPVWGISWTEIVDQSARPPRPQSLAWYRLACSLPARLPASASIARDSRGQALAARDYAFVIDQLGPCTRTLGGNGN